MESKKTGRFIAELRKSKQLTQKALADKLNITDKAVSKWERGLSFPDISLLNELAQILGVTTDEILNGAKNEFSSEDTSKKVENISNDDKIGHAFKSNAFRKYSALYFSALLFIGIITCAICDIAISKAFTWSLYPIMSAMFTWLVFFPVIINKKAGVILSLTTFSILIIPYIYALSKLTGSVLVITIGVRMSVISIIYCWLVFALFNVLKMRKLLAGGISLAAAIPVALVINIVLSKIISEPITDVWDIITYSLIVIGAAIMIYFDSRKHVR